ncbi:MAG: pitrilysin family protein [Bacteroidota bacterium]|nr:insulinase family protein [Candidatus Kapabacteria bacterium]MDW8220222.1 pitrilysin family protein [Bacteroidota bacterium]
MVWYTPLYAQKKSTKKLNASASVVQTATSATTAPIVPERYTSVEGITEYRLPNGLRILLFPDQSKPTITVNITYLVGSRHENYGETGMAHLLEHLVFKGTPRHPNIPEELTKHGARPNGTTWYDRTNYFETFAATDENLEWALDLEADRMVNSFIAKKDLESEMTVVRNEFEAGENNPLSVLLERVAATSYLWHNYGKSTIGCRADIENVPIERLQAFYRTYYQPDNAILLLAGKFDEKRALELITKYFGPIPRPTRVLHKTYTLDPTQDGERHVTLRRVGDIQIVAAAYKICAGAHSDFPALEILNHILSEDGTGRLYKALVDTKKASSVLGFPFQLREPGYIFFGTEVRVQQSLDSAQKIFLSVLDSAATMKVTKEEVERARAALLKSVELTLNNSERVGLVLSEYMAQGDWRLFFVRRDRLEKVTPEDVQRVAALYLKPSNRTTGVFIPTDNPDRSEIPPTPDVESLVKDYKGKEAIAAGEAFDASPLNIEARTRRISAGKELGSISAALLSKKTRGGSVVARLSLRIGDEQSLMNKKSVHELTAEMLLRGTKSKTREQIQDAINNLKARLTIYPSGQSVEVSMETKRENLIPLLKLVREILREPALSEKEFESLRQETLAQYEAQRSEPTSVAVIALERHVSPYPRGHIYATQSIDEKVAELKALTIEDIRTFYRELYGASSAYMSIVGDFDESDVQAIVSESFGTWKSLKPFVRIEERYKDVAPANLTLETPDKANAFFIAKLALPIRSDDPDYPALLLGNYMLGGGFLNSRLATRIRQKEGLSYGVGSQVSASALDKVGSFVAYAIYAPQNRDKLEKAFNEEIDRALKDGFTAEEVQSAKSGFLQSRMVSRSQDTELVARLNDYLYTKRTMMWDKELEEKIAALTPEQVVQAMRKWIHPSKITIVKAGDFAKATKEATGK